MVATRVSEATVAQPPKKLVPIARTASRRLENPSLDIIGFLRGHKAFGEASRSLAEPLTLKQEQEHRERPQACGDRAEQGGNHRYPRFQSSSRA